MLSKAFLAVSAVIFLSLPALAEISCDAVPGVCFEQTSFNVEGQTFVIGISLPREQSSESSPELLASVSVSLPYSFSAFTLGTSPPAKRSPSMRMRSVSAGPAPLAVVTNAFPFVAPSPDPGPALQNRDTPASLPNITFIDMVAQVSGLLPNNTLAPAAGDSVTTISPLSPVNTSPTGTTTFTSIFHLQFSSPTGQIPEIFTATRPKLTAIFSEAPADYLSDITHTEILPLAGSTQIEFELDARAARFSNFDEMLKTLQVA